MPYRGFRLTARRHRDAALACDAWNPARPPELVQPHLNLTGVAMAALAESREKPIIV
jgi:hypothetical protein